MVGYELDFSALTFDNTTRLVAFTGRLHAAARLAYGTGTMTE